MNKTKIILRGLLPIGLTILGTLALIAGEIDDSPGLGGIGIFIILSASFINIRK
jgi:hypothetical protein